MAPTSRDRERNEAYRKARRILIAENRERFDEIYAGLLGERYKAPGKQPRHVRDPNNPKLCRECRRHYPCDPAKRRMAQEEMREEEEETDED